MALTKVSRGLLSTSIVDNGNATAITIDANENVGIGTSPSTKVDIKQSTDNAFSGVRIERSTTSAQYSVLSSAQGTTYLVGVDTNDAGNNVLSFGNSGNGSTYNEAMRIDSSGNLLVGTTDNVVQTNSGTGNGGIVLRNNNYVAVASDGSAALELNRLASDGEIANFRRDGSPVGSIGAVSSGVAGISLVNPTYGGIRTADYRINPVNGSGANFDNSIDLGAGGTRFKDLYRAGSTISTSDRNMKQDIRDLTDAERNVAVAAKGLLKAFRFIDTVEAEGDNANIHFGIIAQDLAAAFTAEGLDANDYQVYRASTFTDDDGNEQTRLGICYENLLAFIIAAI